MISEYKPIQGVEDGAQRDFKYGPEQINLVIWRGLEVLAGAMAEFQANTGGHVFETPTSGSRDPIWRAERIKSDTQLTYFPSPEARASYLASTLGLPFDGRYLEWMQASLTHTRGGPIVLVRRHGPYGRELEVGFKEALLLEREARDLASLIRLNLRRAA